MTALTIRPLRPVGPILLAFLLSLSPVCFAQTTTYSVDVIWNANKEPDIAGYNILYGTSPGKYTGTINVPGALPLPMGTVTGLSKGVTYYFAVTAYNTSNKESPPSIEVSHISPVTAPEAPSGVRLENVRLANISTRGSVGSGDNAMIAGFILVGSGSNAKVLVRAIGPSLASFGIKNSLLDPTLELRDGNGALLRSNDNWKDQQRDEIEATTIAPTTDRESAILANLNPGAYTVIVHGHAQTTGIAIVEVYHLDHG